MFKEEKKEGMTTITKPVDSMDVTVSHEEFEKIIKMINNPLKPSDLIKNMINNYQKKEKKASITGAFLEFYLILYLIF